MSQGSLNVPTIGPVSPTAFAGDINTVADALVSKNSGASAPANFPTTSGGTPTVYQDWADTSPGGGIVDEKEFDGSNWLTKGSQDQTNHVWMPKVGGNTDTIAAAGTTDLGSKRSSVVTITGSVPGTPITSFGNNALLTLGESKFLRFGAAGIITYNAVTMILPGAADLSFNAGDTLQATYLGGGNWLAYNFRTNISPLGRNIGDVFEAWGTGARPGAVRANGNTLGNGASGGTERANADTVNLFIYLYINDTGLTVSGGRTAPGNTRAAAITDYNLNKTIALPTLSPTASKPTRQILLAGAAATYTTPAGCSLIIAKYIGGGAGGGGSGGDGGNGGTTTFNGVDANGGSKGLGGGAFDGGAGGTGGAGAATLRISGGDGGNVCDTNRGPNGGSGFFGGAGKGGNNGVVAGSAGKTNSGGGGGAYFSGGGGGSGEYVELSISSPAATYVYTVGAAGTAGAGGVNGGGLGGTGIIIVEEYYSGNSTRYLAL